MLRLPRLTALKLGADRARHLPRRVAGGRLDLDDVGAEIGEHHRAERPGHHLRDVEHLETVERAAAHIDYPIIQSPDSLLSGA
jgi:hypothetical protein